MYKILKITILFTFLFPYMLASQSAGSDFDVAFLDSLPTEVREDLLSETESKKNLEEPIYRKPSTYIDKPSTKKKNFYRSRNSFNDEYMEDEDSAILKRFGESIFSKMQTTLMPINEPNFDDSYVLDYGDVLEIQIVGNNGNSYIAPVKRDGSVNIDDIGKIYVSGLSLGSAMALIKSNLKKSTIGIDVFVTLVSIRDIQIIVAGNAFNPGPYTLNGNSNIFHALVVSGGPSEIGSYRSIDLIRDNQKIESVDLYQTFIMGKSALNTRLRSGDVIFIRPVSNLVTISGAVRRPAVYEIKNNEDLRAGISFANEVTNKADLSNINLLRLKNGDIETLEFSSLSDLNNLPPYDSDLLVIKKHDYRTVNIHGAVVFPGPYVLNEGDGILELVKRAGGYTKNAYPFGGVLENESTKKVNEMIVEKSYKDFINTLSNSLIGSTMEGDISSLANLMLELKNAPVSGRVSAEFDLKTLTEEPEKNIQLQDDDEIFIPEKLNNVYVFGEVSSFGTAQFESNKGIIDYIDMKGGFSNFANRDQIYILHPNGNSVKAKLKKSVFMRQPIDYEIYPGSIIIVPRKTDSPLLTSKINAAYAEILGNITVSLTSLSLLSNQN